MATIDKFGGVHTGWGARSMTLHDTMTPAPVAGVDVKLLLPHEEQSTVKWCERCASVDDGPPAAGVSASGWIGKVDIRRVGPAVRTTSLSTTRALTNGEDGNHRR